MNEEPFANADDTSEQILAATYRTLQGRGYDDLTINAIGEEFEKSPSLVYRHYDGKDDLILECLSYLLERFERDVTSDSIDDPRARLEDFLDWGLEDASTDRLSFVATLVELRSLAVHDEAYRAHFTRSDEVFARYLADVIAAGIDSGDFQECDPERVARTLVTTLSGAMTHDSTTETDWLEAVATELETYVETRLYARDGTAEKS